MNSDMAALVERLARLELALAEGRQVQEAARVEAAVTRQTVERLGRDLADGLARLDARLIAMTERQAQAETGLDAARTWLADLTRHLEAAQKEANGWATAEQEARTALEQAFWALRERQAAMEQEATDRPTRDRALRAEVTALGRMVQELSEAAFPPPAVP